MACRTSKILDGPSPEELLTALNSSLPVQFMWFGWDMKNSESVLMSMDIYLLKVVLGFSFEGDTAIQGYTTAVNSSSGRRPCWLIFNPAPRDSILGKGIIFWLDD